MESLSKIPILCMEYLGSTVDGEFLNLLGFGGLILQTIVPIGMVNFCVIHRNELLGFLEGMGFVFSNFESISRWYTFFKTSDLYTLYKILQEMYLECDLKERKLLDKANFELKKIIKVMSFLNASSAYGFILFPFISGFLGVYIFKTKDSMELEIPYCSHFPFLPFENKVVFFIWFFTVVIHGTFFVVLQIIVIGLLALISINLGEHLKLLQNLFNKTEIDIGNGFSTIRNAIIKHKKIISVTFHLNETFKSCLFAQCLSGSMHLCVIAFQIVVSSSYVDVLVLVPYCANILLELFIVCYSGQIISYEVS